MPSTIYASVKCICLGIVPNFLIALPIDAALHAAEVFPKDARKMTAEMFMLALSYRGVAAIVGGYVTGL